MSGRYELSQPLVDKEALDNKSRGVVRRVTLGVPFIICILVFVGAYISPTGLVPALCSNSPSQGLLSTDHLKQCASAFPRPATPPAPVNLWASLTIDETVDIQKWLEGADRNLNLTQANVAELNENFVFLIEAYYPSKADALAYLAAPLTAARPSRFARVTLHHGSDPKPSLKDYLVGPLPVGPHTGMRRLTDIYDRDEVPLNARGYSPRTDTQFLLTQITPQLADAMQVFRIFLSQLGVVVNGSDSNFLEVSWLARPMILLLHRDPLRIHLMGHSVAFGLTGGETQGEHGFIP